MKFNEVILEIAEPILQPHELAAMVPKEMRKYVAALTTILLKRNPHQRPKKCASCGHRDGDIYYRLHAHHENYFHPNVVVFLCASCHGRRHSELRQAAKTKSLRRKIAEETARGTAGAGAVFVGR